MAAMDQDVFSRIWQQFAVNAAAWPLRGANAQRTGYDVKVGDLVLEVLSGPVPCMHESVKGPFRVVQVGSHGTVLVVHGLYTFQGGGDVSTSRQQPCAVL
jgi:hypothetical protein